MGVGALLGSTVHAQSIDPSSTQARIGQPLRLEVRVRHPRAPHASLTAECIEATVVVGDTYLGPEDLLVSLHPDPQAGWQRARIQHAQVLQEPVFHAHVSLRCGASYQREFPVLAEPAAPVSVPTPPGRDPQSSKPGVTQARSRAHPSEPAGRPLAEPARPGPSRAAITSNDPRAEEATPAAPLHGKPDEHHSVKFLASELHLIQGELRRTQALLSSVEARLNHQTSETGNRQIGAWTGTALMGLILFGLFRIARDTWHAWRPVRSNPRQDRAPLTTPQAPTGVTALTAATARATLPTVPADPATATETPSDATTHATPHQRPRWPVDTDFGEPSLHPPAELTMIRQLEGYISQGYPGACIALLEKTLQTAPGKNPWYLLMLLDSYVATQQRHNQDCVAAQLEALYNVRIPEHRGQPVEGRDLLEQPDTLAQINTAWQHPQTARAVIEPLLLHPVALEPLDLAAFRDALLLHAIAQLHEAPLHNDLPDFNPMIDWTPPSG